MEKSILQNADKNNYILTDYKFLFIFMKTLNIKQKPRLRRSNPKLASLDVRLVVFGQTA